MQEKLFAADLRVIVKMVDPAGIERAAPPDYSVNFISLFEKKFSKVRTILAGDAGN